MTRASYVFDTASGQVIDRDEFYSRQATPKRSHLPTPMLNLDTMPETQSMATGKHYTSKAALRAEYKALGMVEVGNDPARLRKKERPKVTDRIVSDAIDKAAARYARGERATKA